jgi:hypothetical protein
LPCDDPEWSNFTKFFAQNFDTFGIKKLISTSYAANSKTYKGDYQPTLFETLDPKFDEDKTEVKGKVYILSRDDSDFGDLNKDGKIDFEDLTWDYLEGDGDFRSDEVKQFRGEADIIITNPPFSLFREFIAWIMEAEKKFLVIGNMNAITYKEVFPLIAQNRVWLGPSISSGDREFEVPDKVVDMSKFTGEVRDGKYFQRVMGVRWFTNLDHGRRHQPLELMTMADNLKFNKKMKAEGKYHKYDNYDAIEVPEVKAIPSDYDGVMGVPISFLDKYNPDQFEIVAFRKGSDGKDLVYSIVDESEEREREYHTSGSSSDIWCTAWSAAYIGGQKKYARLFIHKRGGA